MSEKISRRVFLKTTGFAALSVAAASVLGGCDVSPLPGNATLTDFGEALPVAAQDNMSYSISATPLSEEWHSYAAAFESDEKFITIFTLVFVSKHLPRISKSRNPIFPAPPEKFSALATLH